MSKNIQFRPADTDQGFITPPPSIQDARNFNAALTIDLLDKRNKDVMTNAFRDKINNITSHKFSPAQVDDIIGMAFGTKNNIAFRRQNLHVDLQRNLAVTMNNIFENVFGLDTPTVSLLNDKGSVFTRSGKVLTGKPIASKEQREIIKRSTNKNHQKVLNRKRTKTKSRRSAIKERDSILVDDFYDKNLKSAVSGYTLPKNRMLAEIRNLGHISRRSNDGDLARLQRKALKDEELFFKAAREDASKHVRVRGDNIDPYYSRQTAKDLEILGEDNYKRLLAEKTVPDRAGFVFNAANDTSLTSEQVEAFNRLTTNTDIQNKIQKQNEIRQNGTIKKLEEKINNIVEGRRLAFLEAGGTKEELKDIDSVTDSDREKKLRAILEETEEEKTLRKELQEAREIAKYDPRKDPANPYTYQKTWKPTEGFQGYGLGFNNFQNASRTELLSRGTWFLAGAGGREQLMNAFGVITRRQALNASKQSSFAGRFFNNATFARVGAIGGILMTENLVDFAQMQLGIAGGIQGWRIGSSFGGALAGSKKAGGFLPGAGRTLLGGTGGILGFAAGTAAATLPIAILQDMTRNTSHIRQVAKDFSKRSTLMSTGQTRQTLTSRQMTLNKLARSGLNDRAMLLGNEAKVLAGVM